MFNGKLWVDNLFGLFSDYMFILNLNYYPEDDKKSSILVTRNIII